MTDDYLTRVYNRLENGHDVPHERRMLEALTDIQDFVNDFSTECVGINDLPATRQDPSCCECGLTDEEIAEINRLSAIAYRTANAATGEPLSQFQMSWCTPEQWHSLGISPTAGQLITTMDLAHTTREITRLLLKFKSETYRADLTSEVEQIKALFS